MQFSFSEEPLFYLVELVVSWLMWWPTGIAIIFVIGFLSGLTPWRRLDTDRAVAHATFGAFWAFFVWSHLHFHNDELLFSIGIWLFLGLAAADLVAFCVGLWAGSRD